MKPAIKKLIGFFYLLLGFGPLLFVLFLSLKKEGIHYHMKEKLETGKLHTLVLAENAVVWMDKHEIWINDRMFDVQSKKLENGIYTFTGLYDDDETDLINQQRNTSEKEKEQNKLITHFFKCFQNIFYFEKGDFFLLGTNDTNAFISTSSPITSQVKEILTPPPQV